MNYLIVGLGNIGSQYEITRHNIGFRVLDCLAEQHSHSFAIARLVQYTHIAYKGRALHLIKPTTYMNGSGKAVRYWLQHLSIPISRLLIVVDDIALPFGTLRLRGKGSHGGHNGLRDIETGTAP